MKGKKMTVIANKQNSKNLAENILRLPIEMKKTVISIVNQLAEVSDKMEELRREGEFDDSLGKRLRHIAVVSESTVNISLSTILKQLEKYNNLIEDELRSFGEDDDGESTIFIP
jgi:hypothetical protein